MPYPKVNRNGEIYNKHTLKEKFKHYKGKADSSTSKNAQGEKMSFTGRVACAVRALEIQEQMKRNKKNFDYYNGQR